MNLERVKRIAVKYKKLDEEAKKEIDKLITGQIRAERVDLRKFKKKVGDGNELYKDRK